MCYMLWDPAGAMHNSVLHFCCTLTNRIPPFSLAVRHAVPWLVYTHHVMRPIGWEHVTWPGSLDPWTSNREQRASLVYLTICVFIITTSNFPPGSVLFVAFQLVLLYGIPVLSLPFSGLIGCDSSRDVQGNSRLGGGSVERDLSAVLFYLEILHPAWFEVLLELPVCAFCVEVLNVSFCGSGQRPYSFINISVGSPV